jgi:hypothetical protein
MRGRVGEWQLGVGINCALLSALTERAPAGADSQAGQLAVAARDGRPAAVCIRVRLAGAGESGPARLYLVDELTLKPDVAIAPRRDAVENRQDVVPERAKPQEWSAA